MPPAPQGNHGELQLSVTGAQELAAAAAETVDWPRLDGVDPATTHG
jgi:hypothetical protein